MDSQILILQCKTYLFLLGRNANINGNISSLPSSIVIDSTILEKLEYIEKFAAGPTAAKPGPTLFMQETAAVKFVSKSNGSKLSNMNDMKIINIYITK